MNENEKMLSLGESLIVSDDKRLPVTVEHNEEISALAFSAHAFVLRFPPRQAMEAIKTICETLFYLGYQAGQKAAQERLDPEVWNYE